MCINWSHLHTCTYFAADWVDVKDPNVIAETELLQAAASIEAAAKKLAELKPKKTVVRVLGCVYNNVGSVTIPTLPY